MIPTKRSNGLLCSEGWMEFNRIKWKLTPLPLRISEPNRSLPSVETVLYLDSKGRIRMPKLNPYVPVRFTPTPTRYENRVLSQWLAVSELLSKEFKARGLAGSIPMPPEVDDVRAWMWGDFSVAVRYTFYIEFPHPLSMVDRGPRGKMTMAQKEGFTCEAFAPLSDVVDCLRATEARQKFTYGLSKSDLLLARELVGEASLRRYVCYSRDGEPASTSVILHAPGEVAVAWIEGTKNQFLGIGAHQLLRGFYLEDLAKAQATGLDFMGANLPGVSYEKKDWGPQLVPYYVIGSPGWKSFLRYTQEWTRYRKNRRSNGTPHP